MNLGFLYSPAIQLLLLYRVYSYLYNIAIFRPVSYFLYFVTRVVFSSDIHPKAKIGKNLNIRHHFGIVIGKNVIIGNDCVIYNGVSIGQRNVSRPEMPIIGDNTIIYTGAVIAGKGRVENRSIVAANKVVILK